MDRRELLKYLVSAAGGLAFTGFNPLIKRASAADFVSALGTGDSTRPLYAGWVDDKRARQRFVEKYRYPFLSQMNHQIRGTGEGRKVFLWKFFEQVTNAPLTPHFQTIGDCFVKDTLVTMSDGTKKPIQDIVEGEYVVSHLGNIRRVNRTIKKSYSGSLITTTCTGYAVPITSTPDHRFLTEKASWTAIADLDTALIVPMYKLPKKRHIFDLTAGLSFKIKHKATTKVANTFVYCLEVDRDNSFLANGYAVHNCVSHAYGLGVDILTCVAIALFNKQERWIAPSATEVIYAGSRVEVGGGNLRGDGSTGAWAAEFLRQWGALLRQEYLGKYDFTVYDGNLTRSMGRGRVGVPADLEPLAKLHPVKTVSIVRSWEECRDVVANGCPVAMCSNLGFRTTRDKDGFLTRARRPWYHAMLITGIDDESSRPGALVQNSWGPDWVDGPTRYDQPAGSFWVDASTIDAGMRQDDSFALSGYVGYPRLDIPDYTIW